jgi:hypothetical protein
MSLEIEINVDVDGTRYGVNVRQLSMPGQNNTEEALKLFERKIELVRNAMRGNLPPTNKQGIG